MLKSTYLYPTNFIKGEKNEKDCIGIFFVGLLPGS